MENQYGVDVRYCKEKLERILQSLNSYRPEELYNELTRLANTVKTEEK